MREGTTWIDMSTGTRAVGRERARGSCSSSRGGSATDLEHHRPLLDALATRILHVGSAGDGYTVKLLANLLWFGQAVANAEALTLAVRAGLDAETFRHAVQASAAANRFMDGDASAFMAGDNATAFSLDRSRDELTAALELGAEPGVPLLLADRVTDLYGQALERYGDVLGELLWARLVSDRADVHFDGLDPVAT
jgi:3-hydroxyisobutyrate dehydrogenase-like beta-hydroxyacid dehydrogenase